MLIPFVVRKPFGGYNPGEIAGFTKEHAESLVSAGVLSEYKETKADEKDAKAKK